MLTASMLPLNGAGRVRATGTAPAAGASVNGGTPISPSGLLSLQNLAPAVFANGLGYAASGALAGGDALAVASFSQGMPFDAGGRICCAVTGPITHYLAGLPRVASGALAVGALEA